MCVWRVVQEIVFVDLKPENVLVHQSNHIKLSDFGSSRFFDEVGAGRGEGGVTKADRLEGTADYLAPEVLRGEHAVSPASDLWAFACTLYQMLAGRTPIWAGENNNGAADAAAAAAAAQDSAADSSLTPAERAAQRDAAMAAHEAAQKSHMLSKMVQFESSVEDRYPDNFDPQARALIEAIMVPDPAKRIGVRRRVQPAAAAAAATAMEDSAPAAASASSSSGVQWVLDYSVLKSHPFFSSLDFNALPTLIAPNLAGGQVAPAPADAVWAPMPKSYTFSEGSSVVMETIAEDIAKENAPPASVAAAAGASAAAAAAPSAGARSLRAQLFSNKTGSLSAPRFGSLQESPDEEQGARGDSMKLTEGDEEEEGEDEEEEDEEEEDDDEPMDGRGTGGRLHGRMMAAPLPSSSSLPPRAPPKPSSRATGPMAVVEASREEEEDESAAGMLSLAPLARPPAAAAAASSARTPASTGGFGRRSNLPPAPLASSSMSSSGLPPTGIRPSASFVPRADATAGPTGLGMGLRKMGGSSTSSALLARVLNQQSNMHPTTQLPDAQQK